MSSNGRPDLPEGWAYRPLADVAEINPRRPALSGVSDDEPVLFVPMAAVRETDGVVAATEQKRLGEVRAKSYRTFRPNDVLFAKITPCMENGKAAVVPDDASELGFGSTEFHVIRPSAELLPAYVWRYVRQPRFRRAAEANMSGSVGQARVPADFLAGTLIPLPAMGVQAAIVALLAELEERRAAVAVHLDHAATAFGRARAAALTAACTGSLTAAWRADRDQPEVDRDQPEVDDPPPLSTAAQKHRSGAPNTHELVELPSSWKAWAIESITDEVVDYRGRTPPTSEDGSIPHLRTTNISGGRIDWGTDRFVTEETYDQFMTRGIPRAGDVLFTMEAPMGHVGVVDQEVKFSIAQRILLLRPSSRVTSAYFAIALQSPVVRQAIAARGTGSNVSGIAYKRLRSVTIPVPPLDEQEEIVRRVHDVLAKADKAGSAIQSAHERAERFYDSVVAKAFAGGLVTDS